MWVIQSPRLSSTISEAIPPFQNIPSLRYTLDCFVQIIFDHFFFNSTTFCDHYWIRYKIITVSLFTRQALHINRIWVNRMRYLIYFKIFVSFSSFCMKMKSQGVLIYCEHVVRCCMYYSKQPKCETLFLIAILLDWIFSHVAVNMNSKLRSSSFHN